MNFHNVRFPTQLSLGSTGGPERLTEIVQLASGFEQRNSPWEHSRRRYDASVGMRSVNDLDQVISFYEARRGRLFAFRWKDWSDFKSCAPSAEPEAFDQIIGEGDDVETVFQLCKNYRSGDESYCRPIVKPVEDTVFVGVGGIENFEGEHYSLDLATGKITFFEPPAKTAIITAGFEFDVPVRFDTDWLEVNRSSIAGGEVPNIPVVEVRI